MKILKKRHLLPEEVFTPRHAALNKEMYVARPKLEQKLRAALRGSLHLVLHGQSGTGKSWLYKKVLLDEGILSFVANLANASRFGSITAEIKNVLDRRGEVTTRSRTETRSGAMKAFVAEGAVERTSTVEVGTMEPFEACLRLVHREARGRKAILVFDNLEAIFEKEELLKELADLIILLDDERYAAYGVKLLIVGVPGSIREYYFQTPHLTTVANRLYELPEVTRLSSEEAAQLVRRGLLEKLGYHVEEDTWDRIQSHVSWVTERIPQRVHEYCLELARLTEINDKLIDYRLCRDADASWLRQSLYSTYSIIESMLSGDPTKNNKKAKRPRRKNQCLFVLGMLDLEEFGPADVANAIREEFPVSTWGKTLNTGGILGDLASASVPIIRRSPRGDRYVFRDPMYRMCLRAMLQKKDDEVWKVEVGDVL
jgi:hypothetical protein